ncbi:ribulose bisphosphate carboxylase small subunit [Egbenema bharatensis]|uniref:ribulose bisphosphate carboxylase small subunit n=1 Tax=Egbenema bharatensis TaxID=3463334 RepID=UPI003A84FCE8
MSFYIAPRFLNKLAIHITKNFLDLSNVRVPLILGIHGHKGEGKSFQCELVFQRMGIEAVHMSAGELESPDAGDPSRLVRLRYREAAEIIRKRGRMAVLIINDIDAGAGRVDGGTQYTVNTQLVNATLMNIADNPTNVQLPGSYDEEPLPRVPIIVTGNDFGTLYAPLVRDGRMEKFYWEPNRDDRLKIAQGIFETDGLSSSDVEQLVNHFDGQSIDFFGALRSRIYDEQVLAFIQSIGFDQVGAKLVNAKEKVNFQKPNFNLNHLIEEGELMVIEQGRLHELRLASAYNRAISESQSSSSQPSNSASYAGSGFGGDRTGGYRSDGHPSSGYQSGEDRTEYRSGNGKATAQAAPTSRRSEFKSTPAPANGAHLQPEVLQQVRSLLSQGYHIGLEHVDQRRFRSGSWQSCAAIDTHNETKAIEALESCLMNHEGEYVRLFGIEPGAKRRVMENIIQRP